MDAKKIFLVLAAGGVLFVAHPMLMPVMMGAVLAVLVYNPYAALVQRKVPPFGASSFLTLGVTLGLLLPITLLIFFIAKTGFRQLQSFRDASKGVVASGGIAESILSLPVIHGLVERFGSWFPWEEYELVENLQELINAIGLKIADLAGGFMTKIPGVLMAVAVMVVSMYFFLVEGKQLVEILKRRSVFNKKQTDQLVLWMGNVCRSVILASLVSGAAQAMVEMIFCAFLSVPNIPLIGGLIFVASFVPLIGSAPVTIGVALQQFMNGDSTAGGVLLVAAGIVSILDNLIRPLFLRGSANLHPLLAFVAAFGGLQTIGVLGVFLGPIVAAAFVAAFQLSFDE